MEPEKGRINKLGKTGRLEPEKESMNEGRKGLTSRGKDLKEVKTKES